MNTAPQSPSIHLKQGIETLLCCSGFLTCIRSHIEFFFHASQVRHITFNTLLQLSLTLKGSNELIRYARVKYPTPHLFNAEREELFNTHGIARSRNRRCGQRDRRSVHTETCFTHGRQGATGAAEGFLATYAVSIVH